VDFNYFISGFNDEQRAAITAPPGHLAINAAAGTGKTSTLAARILYIQYEHEFTADGLLAVSFSRTAKERLVQKLDEYCHILGFGSILPVYTFHGLAYRILRLAVSHGETWLKPGFEILQPNLNGTNELYRSHTTWLLESLPAKEKHLLKDHFPKILDELRQGSDDFEGIRSPNELPPDELIHWQGGQVGIEVSTNSLIRIWNRYSQLLEKHNKIDYNGLIVEATHALDHPNGATAKRTRDRLKYILADEYQDTSRAQEQLLFALAGNDIYLNVVGDVGQTIYTFNGSSVSNLREFEDRISGHSELPVLPEVTLSENYRSTSNILNAANRIRKLTNEVTPLVVSQECSSVVDGYRERNEPVFLVHAPTLNLAAEFISNEIIRLKMDTDILLHEICILVRKDTEYSPQGNAIKTSLEQKGVGASLTRDSDSNKEALLLQTLAQLCLQSAYFKMEIEDFLKEQDEDILKHSTENINVEELKEKISEYLERGFTHCFEIGEEIQDSLDAEPVPEVSEGNVQMRTVHSAKGEEFRVVFVAYLGDRDFPHGSRPDIEEERRLLYVGVTRAQERLYLVGRPGIHHESFLTHCRGKGAVEIEYLQERDADQSEDDLTSDPETLHIIRSARQSQLEIEKRKKEELWKQFEEEE
jgi:DNA helicase-2/ATP-dependent DNA helicase PcrA